MTTNDQSKQGGTEGRNNRGFATMDPERRREIANNGSKAAHRRGDAQEFISKEAGEAARKGGGASSGNRDSPDPDAEEDSGSDSV